MTKQDENKQDFTEEKYSEESYWDKLANFAKSAGSEVVEKSLVLYYAAQQKETPAWAKATIYSSLAYFISPIDAIPDFTPVVGYGDDLGALAMALATTASCVNGEVKEQAKSKLQDWFG